MRAFVPTQIHTAVALCFAHHHSGCDFDEAFHMYLAEIASIKTRLDFDLATMRLMACLHNGHTAFDDEWLWQTHGEPLGFSVRQLAESWTVVKSVHPSVPVGAEIVALGGVPMAEFAESKLPFLAASSVRAARTILFRRPFLFPSTSRFGWPMENMSKCGEANTPCQDLQPRRRLNVFPRPFQSCAFQASMRTLSRMPPSVL